MSAKRLDMRFAEWLLSLTMPVERAQATVGDLTEDARGPLRFWAGLGQAFGGAIWCSFLSHPFQLFGLAIRYQLQQAILCFLATIAAVGLLDVWFEIPFSAPPSTLIGAGEASLGLLVSFLLGWRMALRRPGRELAMGVSFLVFTLLLWLVIDQLRAATLGRMVDGKFELRPWWSITILVAPYPMRAVAAIAGGIAARRRSLAGQVQ